MNRADNNPTTPTTSQERADKFQVPQQQQKKTIDLLQLSVLCSIYRYVMAKLHEKSECLTRKITELSLHGRPAGELSNVILAALP